MIPILTREISAMGKTSERWKFYLNIPGKKFLFFASVIFLAAALLSLANFLNYVENREGVTLDDPLLNLFSPVDLTWLIFGLIYLSLIIAVIYLIKHPHNLLLAIQCYSIMVVLRITAMYLVPLNPPANMIPLADPFVEIFSTGTIMTKDLFFSGHTATLLILFLTAETKKLKMLFLSCTIIIAVSILLQNVHYTIDVLAAPFFTYAAFVTAKKLNNQ